MFYMFHPADLLMIPAMVFALWAQARVKFAYTKYSKIPTRSGMTGTDVAAIKLVTAQLQTRVLDRAMQVFGAMGLTPDTPLARLWSWGRALRFLDGPDEVHHMVVGRNEVRQYREMPVDPSTAAVFRN